MSMSNLDVEKQSPEVSEVNTQRRCYSCVKDNVFLLMTIVGIVVGLAVGFGVRPDQLTSDMKLWLGMPGELYMRVLKAMVLPLIICSVIDGTARSDARSSGRISLVAMAYISATNALGGIVGVVLAFIANPGLVSHSESDGTLDTKGLRTVDIFADFIRNLFPDNVIGATLQHSQTRYREHQFVSIVNVSGVMTNVTLTEMKRTLSIAHGMSLIGVVVCCMAVGVAAAQVGERSKPLLNFFQAGFVVIFQLFEWIKWSTPLGAASLIARSLVGIEDVQASFSSMGKFLLVVSGGNIAYLFVAMPLMHLIFARSNPIVFLKSLMKPWLLAIGPASTAVALPEILRVSRYVYKVDSRVERFVPAMGVTLNRDGSCLFIAATCMFVAGYAGEELEVGMMFVITALSIVSSFAIPSIPSASVVTVLIILDSLGIPPVNIGLIIALEWLTDRVRTTTNLVGMMNAVAVTGKLCEGKLRQESASLSEGPVELKQLLPAPL